MDAYRSGMSMPLTMLVLCTSGAANLPGRGQAATQGCSMTRRSLRRPCWWWPAQLASLRALGVVLFNDVIYLIRNLAFQVRESGS